MYGLILKNDTDYPVRYAGKKGTDWIVTDVTETAIPPGGSRIIAGLSWVPNLSTDHWGWVFIEMDDKAKTKAQLYLAAGYERGLFDYCVQKYDDGVSRNGDTLPHTKAKLIGSYDGCILTLEKGFNGK